MVLEAIEGVLSEGRIDSQGQLASMVLDRIGGDFALSPSRARRIASSSPRIRIRVFTRNSNRVQSECPFCKRPLKPERTPDIFGNETSAGMVCSHCQFRMDPGKREPSRYVFELRGLPISSEDQ